MSILAKYIAKSPSTAARLLGEETIIMSTIDSTLFSLNATGTTIWEAADGATPLSSIVEKRVCIEFEIGSEQASADAEQFVQTLVEHGVLLLSDQPIHSEEAQ